MAARLNEVTGYFARQKTSDPAGLEVRAVVECALSVLWVSSWLTWAGLSRALWTGLGSLLERPLEGICYGFRKPHGAKIKRRSVEYLLVAMGLSWPLVRCGPQELGIFPT